MKYILFKRTFTSAFQNLWRNKILSLSTLIIISLIIFIFNVILSIHILTQSGIKEINQKVDIILYLKDDIDYLAVSQMISEIKKYNGVKNIIYTSKDDALKSIVLKYPDRGNPFEKYGIDNPLPASITIITDNPILHPEILNKIKESDFSSNFEKIENDSENNKVITKLISITKFTTRLLIMMLISFAIGSTMIIMNALHLTIQNRKQEISIQKLVGAKLIFIKLPFLIEGIFYGVVGGILSSIMLYIFFIKTNLFEIQFASFYLNFYEFIFWQFASCISISIIASLIAVHKYLKNFEF
jgi:cell division transport system permease protein